jgi:hypothetical protein
MSTRPFVITASSMWMPTTSPNTMIVEVGLLIVCGRTICITSSPALGTMRHSQR